MEKGKPFVAFPDGIAIEGISARFAGAEKISHRYIARGSSNFSPNLKGRNGTAGVIKASISLNDLKFQGSIFNLFLAIF